MSNQPYINYNNYAQYYQTQAPPQPQWGTPPQPSRPGWHDPRAQQQQLPEQQPQQASTPGVPYYTPNPNEPVSATLQAHAQIPQTTWGVKYNQHQQRPEPKPVLPPRPQSTTGRIGPPAETYQLQAPIWPARPNDTQHVGTPSHAPSELWHTQYAQHQLQSETPPPPPPRPAEYEYANSNTPSYTQGLYAHKSLSQHYAPSINPAWTQTSGEQPSTTSNPHDFGYGKVSWSKNSALVSPVDPRSNSWVPSADSTTTAPPSQQTTYDHYKPVQTPSQGDPNFTDQLPSQAASALGYGGPSDWEYFTPEHHPVSPESSYSTPVVSKPQTSLGDAKPQHPSSESLGRKTSYAQVEQHRPQSQGTVSPRQESTSSDRHDQGIHRTGTIDTVIHAWNAPLQPHKRPLRNSSIGQSPGLHQARLTDLGAQTPPQSFPGPAMDPYSDLDPQFRASLARFVAMLRKESIGVSDEDKFNVFDSFMQKERRLRAVLYDIDLTSVISDANRQESIQKGAHPSAERNEGAVQQQDDATEVAEDTQPLNTAAQQAQPPKGVLTSHKELTSNIEGSPRSKDDSFVIVDHEPDADFGAYSPGGRPLIPRPINVNKQVDRVPTPKTRESNPTSNQPHMPSPSDNAPQVVGEDYASAVPELPALAAPIVLANKSSDTSSQHEMAATSNSPLPMAVKFEPLRPVYTPFRYAEGLLSAPDALDTSQSADQDYASKRNTYDTGRLMAHETRPSPSGLERLTSPSMNKKLQEDNFLGLIRSHSTAQRKPRPVNVPDLMRPGTTPASNQTRPDPIKDAAQSLRGILPPVAPGKSETSKIIQMRQRVEAFVDDFSFIRENVIPWDRENRAVRKQLDEERHKRQEESEIRLDELFDDNEIAYADLKNMEADFKLAEAERRYEEDKQELESFTKGVYNVVTARLQRDVDELNKEYVVAVDLLDLDSDPTSRMFTSNSNKSSTSDAMELVLQLFEKLNIRYHKLAEARFERERRRKRLELTILYTNGDSEGTKKLEKEFSTAEKLQVLNEARDKDQRASKLMDSFERATVRALGDNQAFLDDLLPKVRRLNDVLPPNGPWQQNATDSVYGEEGARKFLALAQAAVDFVLADSRALLTTSNAADKILNNADYAVSVAEAKAADADESTISKLKADKENEDGKLLEEMNLRMDSILNTPSDATTLIQEIVDRVGNDKEHPDRMKKALEAAKLRNAGKES